MTRTLEVSGLVKKYGSLTAVDDLTLSVAEGEIFGLLGHNGAGKTTTIECVLGTRKRDRGEVRILGLDPVRDRRELFSRVGVQFQHSRFQDKIRVCEACETTACLYPPGNGADWGALLETFGLADKRKTIVSDLSGGERQKLSIVLALIPRPRVLFLDELTTGLDPKARREMWRFLKDLKNSGVTIILTSHYMDEVEYLCDRITILRDGKAVAQGTPRELTEAHGTERLEDVFLLFMEKEEFERPSEVSA